MSNLLLFLKKHLPTPYGTCLIILLLLIGATSYLHPQWKIGGDGFGYYAYLRSAVFDRDFNFENEYGLFDAQFEKQTLIYWRTPLGKAGNPFSVGPSVAWSPFFFVAVTYDQLFEPIDPYPIAGYTPPYQIALGLGTWTFALLGIALTFSALRKFLSPWASLAGVLSIFAISPLPFYLVYQTTMAHGISFFAIALLFWLSSKLLFTERLTLTLAIGIGVSIGIAFLVRWQDVLFAVIPLGLMLQNKFGHQRVRMIPITLASILFVMLPQLLMWHHLYGSWIAVPQTSSFFSLSNPHVAEFLFSGFHGMFVIHPLLIVGIFGLLLFEIQNKKYLLVSTLLWISLLLALYINSGLSDWYGGGSFGARRMISVLPLLALGFGFIFERLNIKKILLACFSLLILTGLFWNLLLAMSYARGNISLDQPTTIQEIYSAPFEVIKQGI